MTHDQAREGAPLWEQPGMSERAFNAWQNTSSTLPLRDRLDAVLAAVGPDIATAVREHVARAIEAQAQQDFRTRRLAYETAAKLAREDADR